MTPQTGPVSRPTRPTTAVPVVIAALAFSVNMMGMTLPAPLYPIYQTRFGFSDLSITVIFAIYAIGVIGTLLSTGPWSDQLGRRPILGVGLLLAGLSSLLFLFGGSLWVFLVARFTSGISAGLFAAAGTVYIVELAPERWQRHAPLIATVANMGGLGLGAIAAGAMAQYTYSPLRAVFVWHLLTVAISGVALARLPETIARPAHPKLTYQSLGLPPQARGVFVPAAIAGFAAFAVLGLFTSIAPAILGRVLHETNHALIGGIIFSVFLSSLLGQIGQQRLRETQRLPTGCLVLAGGMGLAVASQLADSLALLIIGGLAAGIGHGVIFRAGLGAVLDTSPPTQRGAIAATYFTLVYVAVSLPVIGLGVAIETFGLKTAGLLFCGIVTAVAGIALALLQRSRGQTNTPAS